MNHQLRQHPAIITDATPVTRSEFEHLCAGFVSMQRAFLDLAAGLIVALKEERGADAPPSAIIAKLERRLGELLRLTS